MASSAQLRQAVDIFFQKKGPDFVRSTFFPVTPLFDLIIGMNGTIKDAQGIGRPNADVLISGMGYAKPRKASIMAQRQYMPIIMARGPSTSDGDEKSLTDYDHGPSQNAGEDKAVLKAFDQPRAKFVHRDRVLKVWHSELDTTMSSSGGVEGESRDALRGVYEAEHQRKLAVMCLGFSQMLFGVHPDFPSGAPTDEDQPTWDCLHSIPNMINNSNVYCGTDRALAQNAYWRGNYTTAARAGVLEDLLSESYDDFGIKASGGYIDIVVCGLKLFRKFKKEADTKGYRMVSVDKIPNKLDFGTQNEVIAFGFGSRLIYVLCDPGCPQTVDSNNNLVSGHVYLLNSKTFTLAIRGKYNFSMTPWEDQSKIEGGDKADKAELETDIMFMNEVPSWNSIYTTVS